MYIGGNLHKKRLRRLFHTGCVQSLAICDGVRFVPDKLATINAKNVVSQTLTNVVLKYMVNLPRFAPHRYESRVFDSYRCGANLDYIYMIIRHDGSVCLSYVMRMMCGIHRRAFSLHPDGVRFRVLVSRTNAVPSGASVHIFDRTCLVW